MLTNPECLKSILVKNKKLDAFDIGVLSAIASFQAKFIRVIKIYDYFSGEYLAKVQFFNDEPLMPNSSIKECELIKCEVKSG